MPTPPASTTPTPQGAAGTISSCHVLPSGKLEPAWGCGGQQEGLRLLPPSTDSALLHLLPALCSAAWCDSGSLLRCHQLGGASCTAPSRTLTLLPATAPQWRGCPPRARGDRRRTREVLLALPTPRVQHTQSSELTQGFLHLTLPAPAKADSSCCVVPTGNQPCPGPAAGGSRLLNTQPSGVTPPPPVPAQPQPHITSSCCPQPQAEGLSTKHCEWPSGTSCCERELQALDSSACGIPQCCWGPQQAARAALQCCLLTAPRRGQGKATAERSPTRGLPALSV